MAVARFLVEKLLMRERKQCAIAVALERQRHQGLALRRRLPGPGEHQLLVRHDLAIDAADVVFFSVRCFHEPTITAADARIAFGAEHLDFAGTHPARYFFRVRPRLEDFRWRRVEPALDGE